MRSMTKILLFLILLNVAPSLFSKTTQDALEIVSPASGASVVAGTIIEVTVAVPKTLNLSMMTILAQDMTIPSEITSPPFIFKVGVPITVIGNKELIAKGVTTAGELVESPPIIVKVVSGGPFANLNTSPRRLYFNYVGEQQILSVGIRNSGSMMEVNSIATYTTDNVAIATNSTPGIITACGSGSTQLHVQYQGSIVDVPVIVRNAILGDLNADGHIDDHDVAELTRFLGTQASCPNDARDLNHDGKIDEKDLEIMKQLIAEQNSKPKEREKEEDKHGDKSREINRY